MPRHLGAPFNGALVQAQILPAHASLKAPLVREALVRRETPLNDCIPARAGVPQQHRLAALPSPQKRSRGPFVRSASCTHSPVHCLCPPRAKTPRTCGTHIVHASPRLTSFDLVILAHKGAQMLTGPAVRTHAKFVLAADMLVLCIVEHRTCLLWPRVSVRRATLEMRLARTRSQVPSLLCLSLHSMIPSMASIALATDAVSARGHQLAPPSRVVLCPAGPPASGVS
ncbi:hypothetical protein BC826DRAFT_342694 [Russula brevipes]|nr:hypothetical protein BC826DRAFT_342694 [Russula brevipes]